MTLPEAHKQFRKIFKASLNPYLDGFLTFLRGKPILEIGKFDDMLHERHGDYEKEGLSMPELLEKEYGSGTALFIHRLLGLEEKEVK